MVPKRNGEFCGQEKNVGEFSKGIGPLFRRKEDEMYRVTSRRLAMAQPILDTFTTEIHSKGRIDATRFEMALRECWDVGYQEMKDLAEDLLKMQEYRFLAAYYMENSNGSRDRVAMEFKEVLAKLYGIKWYDSPDREVKRKAFWSLMPKKK